jgi:hypothetical protein
MTTPGFTAEASLGKANGHHTQVRLAPPAAAGLLGLAQSSRPVLPSPVQPVQPMPRVEIPVYGNWCGLDYGSGIPWDKVDQVCCRHDKCYCERGDLACSCDRDLLARMPDAIADPTTPPAGRLAGTGIMALFAADPFCLCHEWLVPRIGLPPWEWVDAPFPVPGIPPLKLCPLNYR